VKRGLSIGAIIIYTLGGGNSSRKEGQEPEEGLVIAFSSKRTGNQKKQAKSWSTGRNIVE